MTHPMTAVIIQDIEDGIRDCILSGEDVETNHLRVGADWQLEQVIEWLKDHLDERYIDDGDVLAPGIDAESVVDDFRAAMRPQEDN